MNAPGEHRFCGRQFTRQEVFLIQEVLDSCGGISRMELAHTVCELLDWKRPGGGLKARECREFLEQLEIQGVVRLPAKKGPGCTVARKSHAPADSRYYSNLCGSVEQFCPLEIEAVQSAAERELFRELVSRYHYLGYAMAYGARLQYLVYVSRPQKQVVGCVQFSSPAWKMKVRDQWIGWDEATRKAGLQQVINNSRLLVAADIRNLATAMLSAVMRRVPQDWHRRYGIRPLLAETLVDRQRFYGGCYRAGNWIVLGQTTGRGRMDRQNKRHGAAVKTVLVYPLVKNAAERLAKAG